MSWSRKKIARPLAFLILRQANNPRRLVPNYGDSIPSLSARSHRLSGIPRRIRSNLIFSALHGLRTSRYRGGDAFLNMHEVRDFTLRRFPSCQGFSTLPLISKRHRLFRENESHVCYWDKGWAGIVSAGSFKWIKKSATPLNRIQKGHA